jgi:hypothetical protein
VNFRQHKTQIKMKPLTYAGITLGLLIVFIAACKYDDILPPEPDPGITISFSADVVPIFSASCAVPSCHNGSGPAPDLRAAVAYESLWSADLIDTMEPANSELYLWMSGVKGLPMPPQGSQPADAATVLQWIDQGAKNN